jgi:hypothetical protein
MTVHEYRVKHPCCDYCKHFDFFVCNARSKLVIRAKAVAKKCPLYAPADYITKR